MFQMFVLSLLAADRSLDPSPVDWGAVKGKVTEAAIGIFGILTIYYVTLIWKHGLAMARSGDNPQQMAQAKAGLQAGIIGGVVFFGATTVAGLAMYLAM